MRILVTGSRHWPYDRDDLSAMVMFSDAMKSELEPAGHWDSEYESPFGNITVVMGDCPTGLDFIAQEWCLVNWVDYEVFDADWSYHGKAAGPLRNQAMVDSGADVCIGFPKPGEPSRGTWDCMTRAIQAHIPVLNWTKDMKP